MQKMEFHLYKQQKADLTRYQISSSDSENLLYKQPLILWAEQKGDFLTLNFKTFFKRSNGSQMVQNSSEESFLTAPVEWLRFKWESTMIQLSIELDMILLT